MQVLIVVLALAVASVSAYEEMLHPKDVPMLTGNSIEGRITNGYAATNGSAPYTVGLGFSKSGSGWWCSGSIISSTWVLTAAHCTNSSTSVKIYYGATWRTNAQFTQTVSSSNIIQNSLWPNTNGNDISLIRTSQVTLSSTVNKVAIPSFNDSSNKYVDLWAMACGWGGTYGGSPLPDWLQCADFQIISNTVCAQSYGSLPDGILCVSTSAGKSTCAGDSGGPLVLKNGTILVGVTSFIGSSTCASGPPAGFTRVSAHLDWIRSNSGVAYY